MTADQLRHCRIKLQEAHASVREAITEPGHSPTEDALICAIHAIGSVCASLVDVVEQMNERLPASTEEIGDLVLPKEK